MCQPDLRAIPRGFAHVQIPGVQRKRPRDEQPALGDRFLKTFGKPERILACDCERSNETTLKQVFVLIGDGLNERLADPANRLHRWPSRSLPIPRSLMSCTGPPCRGRLATRRKAAAIEAIRVSGERRDDLPRDRAAFLKELSRPAGEGSERQVDGIDPVGGESCDQPWRISPGLS